MKNGWVALLILAGPLGAQDDWEMPTLRDDLGLHFENPDGTIVAEFSGRQKFTLFVIPNEGTMNVRKNGSLFYPVTDLFFDVVVHDRIRFFVDARMDRHIPPSDDSLQVRAEAWWMRYETPLPFSLVAQFGKFPTPIGNFIPRHDTPQDVLPFRPMPYVTVTAFKPAQTEAQLLASRDRPRLERYGRMLIWEDLYAVGLLFFGTEGPFHYRLAATNNAPSGGPKFWDFNEDDEGNVNVSGYFGVAPWIGLKLGFSFSTGPYLHEDEAPTFHDRESLPHDLLGLSAEFSLGHFAAYAEYFLHRIDADRIHRDLYAHSWYIELQYKLLAGLAAALRFNQNLYSELSGRDWDNATVRVEAGVRWALFKGVALRTQITVTETTGRDEDDFMWTLQAVFNF